MTTRVFNDNRCLTRRILAHTALVFLLSSVVLAQNPSPIDANPWHGFAAVAPLSMTDDAQDRLGGSRLADQSSWLLDSAVFVHKNVGIGVEMMPLGSVTRQQSYSSFGSNDAEDEQAVLIMARARTLAKRQFALDIAFGGGLAFQHWSFHSFERFAFPPVINDRVFDEKNPVLSVGVDAPVSLIPHLALLPILRVHLVNHNSERDTNGWSTRVSVGIGAGVKW